MQKLSENVNVRENKRQTHLLHLCRFSKKKSLSQKLWSMKNFSINVICATLQPSENGIANTRRNKSWQKKNQWQ